MDFYIQLAVGTVLTLIVGVIGYFLQRTLSAIDGRLNTHDTQLTNMDQRMSENEKKIELNTQRDEILQKVINDKLDSIGRTLEKIDSRFERYDEVLMKRRRS